MLKNLILKIEIFYPKQSSSRDKSQTEEVLLEFLKKKKINKKNYIFLVQPTSPYIRSFDYKNAFKKLQKTKKQSLLSVIKSKKFFGQWTENQLITV